MLPSSAVPSREPRPAPTQVFFDSLDIPDFNGSLKTLRWIRLAQTAFTSQFYASKRSRLTPNSWAFPCVYIAPSERTAVAEIWGDRFYAEKAKGGKTYVIPADMADAYSYLSLETYPSVNLCDLTDASTLISVGLDMATLHAPDINIPQTWADRIANHPSKFDGILYPSRHTLEPCAVIWERKGGPTIEAQMKFTRVGPFRDSVAAYEIAKLNGLKLSFS